MILAGDVGGTNTRLALYEPGAPVRAPRLEARLSSRAYPSLVALTRDFLAPARERPADVVLGIAGPIVDQTVDATNLAWNISAAELAASLGARVLLINDLEATAHGLAELADDELTTLQPGVALPGNRALVAAGTGLGEALLVPDGAGWRPSASEGGHTDFAPRDPLEDELLVWLRARHHGRVSYERVLSGPGIVNLYRFLAETGRGDASPAAARAFAEAADPAPVVTGAALDGSCGRARLAMELFVSIYGAEAGNLALKALAVNGVYLAGGIAPRILPLLEHGPFLESFGHKGRLGAMLRRVPVHVVREDRVGLWGAARRAQQTAG
jgi:glucokinase